MIIIYGTKKIKRVKEQSKGYLHCDHCGKDSKWQFSHMWTWGTLYYIPLIPVWREKIFSCPMCGWGIKVNKQNNDAIMAALGHTTQQAIPQSQPVQQGSTMPQQNQAANPNINNRQQGSSQAKVTNAKKVRVCPTCHLMFFEGQATCNVCGKPLRDK